MNFKIVKDLSFNKPNVAKICNKHSCTCFMNIVIHVFTSLHQTLLSLLSSRFILYHFWANTSAPCFNIFLSSLFTCILYHATGNP